jgi:hypothetical protein
MKLGTIITTVTFLLVAIFMFILAFGFFFKGAIWQGFACFIVFLAFGVAGIVTFMESGDPKKPNI